MHRTLKIGGAALVAAILLLAVPDGADARGDRGNRGGKPRFFRRLATFPVYLNSSKGEETAAEIIDATRDGRTLVYSDSPGNRVGFVDIRNPSKPKPDGNVDLDGEPTSVAVAGRYVLVGVNTSADFVNTSGHLAVVDIRTRQIVASIDLGGQPDSVAVSPDGRYAAIAIENERDEDLGDGRPPQMPAGYLSVVRMKGHPGKWTARKVDLTGLADSDRFPNDPEPEFVDINKDNIAVVSMQENNHIVLVDLEECEVVDDFSAGGVDLDDVDTVEDDCIRLNGSLDDVRREPDALKWIGRDCIITANEGDLDGGSRGFSIFSDEGKVIFDSGNAVEHLAVRLGHYPEGRSENKGTEPEGVAVGKYGRNLLAFVGSERSNFIGVYNLRRKSRPEFVQALPVQVGPEGLLPIPHRKLFVVASEEEDEDEGIRSTITIWRLDDRAPEYPEIYSLNDDNGLPIPWGALSGLAADRKNPYVLYAVTDSFYEGCPRILKIDTRRRRARIVDEFLVTENGEAAKGLDLEGIVQCKDGGFWLASEGDDSPDLPNLLIRVNHQGEVQEKVGLPNATDVLKTNNGFEGVALRYDDGEEVLYAAIQREWSGDPGGCIRVGEYRPKNDSWRFFYYPKSDPTSPNGGWVGLSEIVVVDDDTLAFIERDNQRGPDARIKWITEVSIKNITPVAEGGNFPKATKKVVRDLLPDLNETNGWTQDKVEGLAINVWGKVFVVTDNDGVDDATGETLFLRLGDYDELDD